MKSIHRLVLRRLLLAWVVISLLLGGVTWLHVTERMEKAMVDLANTRMQELALDDLLDLPPEKNSQDELQRRTADFLRQNLVQIEISGADGRQLGR